MSWPPVEIFYRIPHFLLNEQYWGYAPELNPDEFVWNHIKRQGVSKKPLRQGESLRSRVQADLDAIRARPALVRSFFRAPSVAYTTD